MVSPATMFQGLASASSPCQALSQRLMTGPRPSPAKAPFSTTKLAPSNKVLTAIRMEPVGEFYTKWKAIEAMEQGMVVIMAAGTGSPYFTTDTGSSLRGIEIEADVMLKGTRVDGIYTADPEKDPTATKFQDISYDEVISRGLKVMDITATAMCKQNNLPIYVFNMDVVGNLMKVMQGEEIGTFVHP